MNYIDTDHIGAADAKPINSHAEWNDEVVFSTIRCQYVPIHPQAVFHSHMLPQLPPLRGAESTRLTEHS